MHVTFFNFYYSVYYRLSQSEGYLLVLSVTLLKRRIRVSHERYCIPLCRGRLETSVRTLTSLHLPDSPHLRLSVKYRRGEYLCPVTFPTDLSHLFIRMRRKINIYLHSLLILPWHLLSTIYPVTTSVYLST